MKQNFFQRSVFFNGAWDYEGHHAINELALASLPADFGI
jgi:hypothetical protein